jgi:hypothetical protein
LAFNKETTNLIAFMAGVLVASLVASTLQRMTGWIVLPWTIGGAVMSVSLWLFQVAPNKRTIGRLIAIFVATSGAMVSVSLILNRVLNGA